VAKEADLDLENRDLTPYSVRHSTATYITEDSGTRCKFCSTENQSGYTECRSCGRPLNLEQEAREEEKLEFLERLKELEEKGILKKLDSLKQ
jgi:hypothetical protein